MQSQQTGERTGSRPSAAGGGGAQAPALSPADHWSTSTQLLPGDRALLPPSPAENNFRKLDASVGASGPHGFAVRISAARLASLPRPPHPAPNVRDDRDTPLSRGRDSAEGSH